MNWERLLSTKRVSEFDSCAVPISKSQFTEPRSPFERDCDQITFSYPFRRLQDKTQVIPFPEFDFVHTRLTHSLEVASVGRSFGKLAADLILSELTDEFISKNKFERSDIGALVAGACLAHDIGNPPFGHSGEDAISIFFKESESFQDSYEPHFGYEHLFKVEGGKFWFKENEHLPDSSAVPINIEDYLENARLWADITKFEGNANGFRILTRNCDRGINPTAALLGVFTKYPRESYLNIDDVFLKGRKSLSKYGFFNTERNLFKNLAEELGLIKIKEVLDPELAFCRHPLAFLMEASDDIAYGMIDFEDGCRLGLIDFDKEYKVLRIRNKKNQIEEVKINRTPKDLLIEIASKDQAFNIDKVENANNFKEAISYLRAKVINVLIHECFVVFKSNYEKIMTGTFDKSLIDEIPKDILNSLDMMKSLVRKFVYNYQPVLQSEASGFEVVGKLIDTLAISSGVCYNCGEIEDARQRKLNSLLPEEYMPKLEKGTDVLTNNERYERVMLILDYISGMTDNYAISLYRKISGMALNFR